MYSAEVHEERRNSRDNDDQTNSGESTLLAQDDYEHNNSIVEDEALSGQTGKRSRVDAAPILDEFNPRKRLQTAPRSREGTSNKQRSACSAAVEVLALDRTQSCPDEQGDLDHWCLSRRRELDTLSQPPMQIQQDCCHTCDFSKKQVSGPRSSLSEVTITATLHSADGALHMTPADPVLLLRESFGGTERSFELENVKLRLLSPSGPWQMSGKLRFTDHGEELLKTSSSRPTGPHQGSSAWRLQQRARALCTATSMYGTNSNAVSRTPAAFTDADDEEEEYYGENDGVIVNPCNQRWDALDEKCLLTWKRENKAWAWIFAQFPIRTPGAIRTRYHMLLKRNTEADCARDG